MPVEHRIGDIWKTYGEVDAICITVNNVDNSRGELVMGRGIALQAKQRFPLLPKIWAPDSFPKVRIFNPKDGKNTNLVAFPTKFHWKYKSSLELIKNSAMQLVGISAGSNWASVSLTRPGCGNGGLEWDSVSEIITPIFERSKTNFIIFTPY